MPKRRPGVKNPNQDPDLAKLDPLRRFTGGETPAEVIARTEKERRYDPLRNLRVPRGGKGR